MPITTQTSYLTLNSTGGASHLRSSLTGHIGIVNVRVSYCTNMRGVQWHVIHISFVKNLSLPAVLVPQIQKKEQQMYHGCTAF